MASPANEPRLDRLRRLIDRVLAHVPSWIKAIARKEREERFTRDEQMAMVMLAHVLILAGVWLIMWRVFDHGLPTSPPTKFIAFEIAILVMCFVVEFLSPMPFVTPWKKFAKWPLRAEKWIESHGTAVRARSTAIALLIAYILQFVAFTPLLEATGGPIDSPFAQMALVIGIFTPFIANKPWTMGFAVLTTVLYYAFFVASFGFEDVEAQRPTPGSFVAVNVLILVLAFVLTLLYQNRREGRSINTEGSRIRFMRSIDAPREQVWGAWTNPSVLAQWFRARDTSLSEIAMDVKTGGTWRATMSANGDTTRWQGVYTEVKEPEKLVFTVTDEAGDELRIASVTLVDLEEGKTQLIFQESDSRNMTYERGWSSVLERMAKELERGAEDSGNPA